MESYTSGSSNETAWQSLIASLLGWVILDSYIYFAAVSGQFANVNPVELYTIGFYGFAILSGAVGGNLFRFLEISVSGHTIGRKQVFEGILFGSVVGFVLVFALYFIAPSLSIIGLPSNSLTVTAAVDPVPLSILHFYSVAFPSAYIIVFFLVVAIGEELMVLISFKSLDVTLRDWRLGGAVSILLALFVAGTFWGISHTAAYSLEGVPLIAGISEAIIIGTIFFRYLSFVIWKDLNFSFMVSSHFVYDVSLTTIVPSLSIAPVNLGNSAALAASHIASVLANASAVIPHLITAL